RERLRGAEPAIDPIAQQNRINAWLDVNVRRTQFHRLGNDLIDESNGWRFACQIAEPLDVDFACFCSVWNGYALCIAVGINGTVGPFIIARCKEVRNYRHAGQIGERADLFVLEGVYDADHQSVALDRQRHNPVPANKTGVDDVRENWLCRYVSGRRQRK